MFFRQGWGSEAWLSTLDTIDEWSGRIAKFANAQEASEPYALVVTADHGGIGKKHGGATMAEIEIPWILAGPGVAAGRELQTPVRTYDTALTVAYILGVRPSDCWIGRPVLEAFAGK